MSDLVERGLDADRVRLWVIDGGKALRKAGLKEADAGDFASDKDVAALAKKWKVNAR